MIITLFIVLVAVTFFLLAFGFARGDDSLKIIGFVFLFLLSFSLINENISYESYINTTSCDYLLSSSEQIYVYGNNYTGYHWDYDPDETPPQFNDVNLFHVLEDYNYTLFCTNSTEEKGFSDYPATKTYGIWLAIVSLLGFAGVFYYYRRRD